MQVAVDVLEAVAPVEDPVADGDLSDPGNDELDDLQEVPEKQ